MEYKPGPWLILVSNFQKVMLKGSPIISRGTEKSSVLACKAFCVCVVLILFARATNTTKIVTYLPSKTTLETHTLVQALLKLNK